MGRTATDLKKGGWPREEMDKYYPWASIDRYGQDKDMLSRRDRALVVSREIAGLLKKKYKATRVVLFGSLAHKAWFTPRSDIDIYAEGIPVPLFFQAESDAQKSGESFKIDLVDPEECSPELLRKIEEEGIDL